MFFATNFCIKNGINWKIATKTNHLTNWYWFHVRIIGRKHSNEKNYITYMHSALEMRKNEITNECNSMSCCYVIWTILEKVSFGAVRLCPKIYSKNSSSYQSHIALFFRFYSIVICMHKTITLYAKVRSEKKYHIFVIRDRHSPIVVSNILPNLI